MGLEDPLLIPSRPLVAQWIIQKSKQPLQLFTMPEKAGAADSRPSLRLRAVKTSELGGPEVTTMRSVPLNPAAAS